MENTWEKQVEEGSMKVAWSILVGWLECRFWMQR